MEFGKRFLKHGNIKDGLKNGFWKYYRENGYYDKDKCNKWGVIGESWVIYISIFIIHIQK